MARSPQRGKGDPAYLEVISKVVPKIWALTNSAMVATEEGRRGERKGGKLLARRIPRCSEGERWVVVLGGG